MRTISALALFVCLWVFAQQQPKEGLEVIAGDVGKKLDAYLKTIDSEEGGFCGNAIVAIDGKVILEKGYGFADAEAKRAMPVDALWDWASVSKQFTAAAVLRLQDMKKLKIDDPLKKLFPNAPKDKTNVTLRQLLNHTSGIESGFKKEWTFDATKRDSFVDLVLKLPMTSAPGEKWEYSNSGYSFLGAIIEIVSGKSFEEFCSEELFKRAGLKNSYQIGMKELDLARVPKIDRGRGFTDRSKDFAFAYGNRLTWGYRACGGTVMTTRDMYLWDRALRGDKLLSEASKESLYTVRLNNYALGWHVNKRGKGRVASHSGGVQGVVTYVERGIDEDFIVALTHSYSPKVYAGKTAQELLKLAK
ncbi:MAG: serine hydrolase domain-containing protein [Planctomycetota bacterium]